jgi:aspartyl/glutamyl-tRNA(Asn/Gln) amidotransferase C subunit
VTQDPEIDDAWIRKLEGLVGLQLSGEERTRFAHDLSRILAHVAALEPMPEAATHEEYGHYAGLMRPDIPRPFAERDAALGAAPMLEGSAFRVPRVIPERPR